jgi:colanic acid biosynthesis glycosyl transferase WcaI
VKLKVTVWGINYAPEVVGIGPYNAALCRFLLNRGHSAQMVTTFPYYPAWAKEPKDRYSLFRTDHLEDVPVHRCWHFVPKRPSPFKRILHEVSFVALSFVRLLLLPRPDVVVVVSPPLLLGAAAWLLCALKRAPFLFHVQDIQPDAAVGMGMLKRGVLTRVLYGLEALAYHRAHLVSGITQGMLEAFRIKGVASSKIVYFPNSVRLPPAQPAPGVFRKRLGLDASHFLAVYSGNLGVKQGLDVLIEAAARVSDSRIRIIICGDGARREALAWQVAQLRLNNVIMLPLQQDGHYEEMLVDADLAVISQQKNSGACFFPSKLLSCLAFAKPIVTVADKSSELAVALKRGCFGMNVEPGNPHAVAAALEALAGSPNQLLSFSRAGAAFVRQFESYPVHLRFEQELLSLAGKTRFPAAPLDAPSRTRPTPGESAEA